MSKNIVITGASRGIGRELAKIYLENGHRVLAVSRNAEKLKELKDFEQGGEYRFMAMDLTNYAEIALVAEQIEDWGRVDVLFNNAGYLVSKPFEELSERELDTSIAVNYKAPFRLIQVLLPRMHSDSHIVNITTMGAVQGSVKFPGLAAYSSSKAGIITLTELLAEELKEKGPKINSVALGAVQTEMLEEAFPGYKAPVTAEEMAAYLYEFGLNGQHFQNGKLIQLSVSTP